MKRELIDEISIILLKKGYTVKSFTGSCFDILARSGSRILLIKVLEDANSVSEEFTGEMHRVADYIGGSALIISEKAGDHLRDNVVYSRFGIYTLNKQTFSNCLENKFPFVKRSHAGLTARVMGDKLREMRDELGISLNTLSKKIGVSRKMIQKYETGKAEVTVARALKMYDVFGRRIFDRIDIFQSREKPNYKISNPLSRKYVNLGFEALETRRVPCDIIAKKDKEIILTSLGDKKIKKMHSLARLLDADNLVIFKKKKPKDIPAMTKEEFLEYKKAKELLKFLKEF